MNNGNGTSGVKVLTVGAAMRATRRAEVLRMKTEGLSQRQIAKVIGYSRQTVTKDLRRALDLLAEEHKDMALHIRHLEAARLDRLLAVAMPKALEGNAKWWSRALTACESRRRLFGADAPTKLEAVIDAEPKKPWDQVIREVKAEYGDSYKARLAAFQRLVFRGRSQHERPTPATAPRGFGRGAT